MTIADPKTAYAYIKSLWGDNIDFQETVLVLLLDRNYQVINHEVLFKGGTDSVIIDTAVLFRHAVDGKARKIIVAHNHPSGSRQPSKADIEVSRQIQKGAEVLKMGIAQLIITDSDFTVLSFFDRS